jgi:hypothetical protein
MRKMFLLGFALMGLIQSAPAWSNDLCKARVLQTVPAIEDPTSVLKRGSFQTAISVYRIDAATKRSMFCSHGGYCYPEKVQLNGGDVLALQLVNCEIGSKPDVSYGSIDFEVIVVRGAIPTQKMRESDVADKLSNMGLCLACASNAAAFYVRKPDSQCSNLVRGSLEDNPVTFSELKRGFDEWDDVCKYWK